MTTLRATLRIAALTIITIGAYVALLAWRLAEVAGNFSRTRWQSLVLRHWARATCAILGVRIEARGPIPGAPFLLVSNHLGYLDVAVLASRLDCVFVAKKEVANWPIIGSLCRSVGTIFIDRESRKDVLRANVVIKQALDEGRGVVFFPEGTSSRGYELLPFRASLFEQAARRDIPVNYAAITYDVSDADPPADRSVCWWGDMTFCSHFYRLIGLRRIEARVLFGGRSMRANDRKVLARKLWLGVNTLFAELTTGLPAGRRDPMPSSRSIWRVNATLRRISPR